MRRTSRATTRVRTGRALQSVTRAQRVRKRPPARDCSRAGDAGCVPGGAVIATFRECGGDQSSSSSSSSQSSSSSSSVGCWGAGFGTGWGAGTAGAEPERGPPEPEPPVPDPPDPAPEDPEPDPSWAGAVVDGPGLEEILTREDGGSAAAPDADEPPDEDGDGGEDGEEEGVAVLGGVEAAPAEDGALRSLADGASLTAIIAPRSTGLG
ncbi:hypothetical protein ACFFX0_08785 [Citricoccus parietis]|uniref:Uncharacterized protein n=1 Tax=Citricoccus parietis TaxID=592307 RepID=A0ABV5FX80_9MICC